MSAYQREDEEAALLIPPDNFCMVEPSIYRSGFPTKKHFPFLKTLNLRTILYLCPEDYPDTNLAFLNQQHVQLLQFGVNGNKEPFQELPHDIISEALVQILDSRNHPILIHCNKGKHRTGCVVGVLHKVLGWSLAAIFEEYRMFSRPKERFVDQQFIECWQMCLPESHSYMQGLRMAAEGQAAAGAAKGAEEGQGAGGEGSAASSTAADGSSTALLPTPHVPPPLLIDDKAAYLINPEVNEHLLRRGREKEQKALAAAAAAAAREPPATTSHASLQHHPPPQLAPQMSVPSSAVGAAGHAFSGTSGSVPPTGRSLAHHQHAHSQPNLMALVKPRANARQDG